jgi:hypothetical protein
VTHLLGHAHLVHGLQDTGPRVDRRRVDLAQPSAGGLSKSFIVHLAVTS